MSECEDRNRDEPYSQKPTDMSTLENDSVLLEDIKDIVKGNEDLHTLISDVLRQRFSKSWEENEAATSMSEVLVPHEEIAVFPEGTLENNASDLNRVNISNFEFSPLSNHDGNVKENVSLRPYEDSADDEDSVTSDSSSASNWLTIESDEDSKYPSTLDDDGRSNTEESSGSEFGRGKSSDSFRFSFARQKQSSSAISSEESSDSRSTCEEESPRITNRNDTSPKDSSDSGSTCEEEPPRIRNRDGTSSEDSSDSDCSTSDGLSFDEENVNLTVRVRIVRDVHDSEESNELETSSESNQVSHLNSESVSDSESDFNQDKSYTVSGSNSSTSESLDSSDCADNYRYNPKSREFVSESESSSTTETADEMWMENEDSSQIYSDIGTPLCMKTGKDKIIIFERNKIDKNFLADLDLLKIFDSNQSCSKEMSESREAPISVNVSEKDESSSLKPYDKQMFNKYRTEDRVLVQYESEDDVSFACDFSETAESGVNPSRSDLPSTSSSNEDFESGSGNSPSYKRYPSVSEEVSPIVFLPGTSALQSNVSNTYRKF